MHELYLAHVARATRGVAEALGKAGWDAVVIHSGTPLRRTRFDDLYWPLRVNPHFAWFAPLEAIDSAIVVHADGRRPRLLWNVALDYWDGAAPVEDPRFVEAFETAKVAGPEAVKVELPTGAHVAFVGEDLARAAAWGFAPEQCTPAALLTALDALRVHKTAYELACLVEANRLAAAGHLAVRDAFLSGVHAELDLHLLFLGATRQDATETPYSNIVALDAHAATLHHVHYGRDARPASTLLLDAGARFRGYASDITRTYVKGQSAGAAAFTGLLAGLEKLQQQVCGEIKVGDYYEALHNRSHEHLAVVLSDLGVIKASPEELVATGTTRLFLPHGLGHSLGLCCHDVGCALEKPRPDNPFLRNTARIEPDQCFTIEPGCYFIPQKLDTLRASPLGARADWKLIGELAALGGVRIEDDVVVRASGPVDNLTRAVLPS
jgi:Xaa-Pro dipeptidase